MHICQNGGAVNVFVARIRSHPRNVILNAAGKQLHVLRKISEVLSELPGIPIAQIHEIEPHITRGRQD